VSHGLQHTPHALQPAMGLLHAIMLLRWPQLFGTTHLQVTMHSPGDCEPLGSGMHLAAAELQLYITGVGGGICGVGGGVHCTLADSARMRPSRFRQRAREVAVLQVAPSVLAEWQGR
jgi:hypothetical protein